MLWVLIAPIEHSPLGKNDKNVIYLSSNTYLICSSANQLPMEPRHEKTVFFCICENKDADHREADQRLCFRYTDSTIPLLPKYEISRF